MDDPRIIDLLEELAERLGLQIRHEPIKLDEELGSRPGGACLLRGQRLIILNPNAGTSEKIRILAEAVRGFDLEQIYIHPVLRDLLDSTPAPKPESIPIELDQEPVDAEE